MIDFEKFTLKNGLKVIVHTDTSTPIVAINLLYNIGSRDEDPNRTGFAHLFEHLMFGGSVNIPKYDEPLQKVGGENNAFTSNDITNYYLSLPKQAIETGFWLESDRMLSLAFSEKSLEVQRNVVVEEFNQNYLNQPYGDVWLLLKPLAYKVHPYLWNTIGKEISHISNAKMEDVKAFFKSYYCPNNAILVVGGDVTVEEIKVLTEKWFGPIPRGPENNRSLPKEPKQSEYREQTVKRNVPQDAIYKAYHCASRFDKEFYIEDLMSDILSSGNSARLYNSLVKKKKLFSEINAYITSDLDEGLFMLTGKVNPNIEMRVAEAALDEEISLLKKSLVIPIELKKVKNKIEARHTFSETNVLNKCMNLAFCELMGDVSLINSELEKYNNVTAKQIKDRANVIFKKSNCSTLYYLAEKSIG